MARRKKEMQPLIFNCYINGELVKQEDLKNVQITNQGYIDLVEGIKAKYRREIERREMV